MRKQEGTSILSLHPGAKAGCSIGKVCEKCPLYRFVETKHPQTGEDVREWDCIFVWQVMWAGDNSRQTVGVHEAVNQAQNEANRRQDEFLDVLATGVLSRVDTRLVQLLGHLGSLPSPRGQREQPHLLSPGLESDEPLPGGNGEDHRPAGQ